MMFPLFPGVFRCQHSPRRRRLGALYLLLACLFTSPASAMQVVFISPGKSDEPFWMDAIEGLQHAATSLGVELEVLHAERDHLAQLSLARDVSRRPPGERPDYLLLSAEKQVLPGQLQIAEGAGIRVFAAYNGVLDSERDMLGYPRGQLKHWLGSLVPNAEEAGYLSARSLILQGLQQFPASSAQRLEMIAISGDKSTDSSRRRTRGMEKAVAEFADVRLRQNVYGEWRRDNARYQTPILLERYPQTRLIWTGNDLMAYGAIDGARGVGRAVGRDVLVSTVNMTEQATRALLEGEVQAMVGGHHLAAAWALVVLYDYDNGVDFADSEGLEMEKSMFALFDQSMAEDYLNYLAAGRPPVDYRRFSKALNPAVKSYEFSIRGWLAAANEAVRHSAGR